jgi:hypothetical protein
VTTRLVAPLVDIDVGLADECRILRHAGSSPNSVT